MKSRRLRRLFIGLILLALAVGLSWSPACLWYAKRQAMQKFASNPASAILNITLAPEVRQIKPVVSGDEPRVSIDANGYRYSLPAAHFQVNRSKKKEAFESPTMFLYCMGTLDLKDTLTQAAEGDATFSQYIAKSEPYQLLLDIFNARPMDIPQQPSMTELKKHLLLLLCKSMFAPNRVTKNWEQFDTGLLKGIIAGNTSTDSIGLTFYMPYRKLFIYVLVRAKTGMAMEDLYATLAEMQIEAIPATQPANATQPASTTHPATESPATQSSTQPTTQNETAESLLRRASEEEFGDVSGCVETIEVARAIGVDFQETVAGCLKRDPKAMHTFFRLSVDAHLDAAASEGYAAVAGKLMETLGDEIFGSALAAEPPDTRNKVRDYLFYDQGVGEWTDEKAVTAKWANTFTDSK